MSITISAFTFWLWLMGTIGVSVFFYFIGRSDQKKQHSEDLKAMNDYVRELRGER